MTYLSVRKFSELQHYKDRPENPWIKFHVKLLDDEEMKALPLPTRFLWDQLLLLAQRNANVIRNDPEAIASMIRMEPRHVREGITDLLKGRWLSERKSPRRASKPASKPASPRARPENRTEKALPGVPTDPSYAANGNLPLTQLGGGYEAELRQLEKLQTKPPDYKT